MSVMVRVPLVGPMTVGENVTLIVQKALAARLPPQLLVWPKLTLVAMLVMVNWALPVLVRVMGCAALVDPTSCAEKVNVEGDKPTAGATPVPAKLTVWGLLESLSIIVSVPVRDPVCVGVNVTSIVQLSPAPTEAPQLLVSPKSPLAPTLEMVTADEPLLVKVTGCEGLVVPTPWSVKVKLPGETVMGEDWLIPLKAITCGLLGALSEIETAPVDTPVPSGV